MSRNRSFSNRLADFALGTPRAPLTITAEAGSEFYDSILEEAVDGVGLFKLRPSVLNTSGEEDIIVPVVPRDGGPITNKYLSLETLIIPMTVPDSVVKDEYIDLMSYFTAQAGKRLSASLYGTFVKALKQCYDRKRPSRMDDRVDLASRESLHDFKQQVIAPYRVSKSAGWLVPCPVIDGDDEWISQVPTLVRQGASWSLSTGADDEGAGKYDRALLAQYNGECGWYGDWAQMFMRLHTKVTFCYGKNGMSMVTRAVANVIDDNGLRPFWLESDPRF